MRIEQSQFIKGVNKRLPNNRQDDPTRLFTLQNARLQKRGETGVVSRIEGFAKVANTTTTYQDVLDVNTFDDNVVVLWYDDAESEAVVTITNTTTGNEQTFTIESVDKFSYGKIIIQEDVVFIFPYNKQLNLIDGTWYVNDFKSTTPLLSIDPSGLGEKATATLTIVDPVPAQGESATGTITNISPSGMFSGDGDYKVVVGDAETNPVTINSSDSDEEARDKFFDEINNTEAITTDWTVSKVGTTDILFTAIVVGEDFNDVSIEIEYVSGSEGLFATGSTTSGGINDDGSVGRVIFKIDESFNPEIYAQSSLLFGEDTTNTVAQKIANGFIGSDYDVTVDDNVITITAKQAGEEWNRDFFITYPYSTTSLTEISTTGGLLGAGNLELNQDYWYTVRHVYSDGHKTTTCFPKYVNTEGSKSVTLLIDSVIDLDGDDITIEIFRRKAAETFFLIDRVTVDTQSQFEYTDDGKSKIQELDQQIYIWSDQNRAAEIVRDRLVKANVKYEDRIYNTDGSLATSDIDDENSLIPNIDFTIYSKARYNDGLLSQHSRIGSVVTELSGKGINVTETKPENVKEIGYYSSFIKKDVRQTERISFPTLEIYNANVPSLATIEEDFIEQDRPLSPHIFLGFKQLLYVKDPFSTDVEIFVRDNEWGSDSHIGLRIASFDAGSDLYPNYLTMSPVIGANIPLLYKKVARKDIGAVYEIAWLDGLSSYVNNADLKLILQSTDNFENEPKTEFNLSSSLSNSRYKLEDVSVVGIEDKTALEPNEFDFVTFPVGGLFPTIVAPASVNRTYLQMNSESIYADINTPRNNTDVFDELTGSNPQLNYTAIFNILNVIYKRDENPLEVDDSLAGESFTRFIYNDEVIQQVPDIDLANTAIYLGSTRATGTTLVGSGLRKNNEDGFVFWNLPEYAITEQLITEENIENFNEEFRNQIIWSERQILGTGINGLRNFKFTNVNTISNEYGQILDVRYIGTVLLVFCERGVAVFNVGESLTQQAGGQVFVDSSQLLTSHFWILKNIPNIQSKSIQQYENMLMFCDGVDVWMWDGQLNNISSGQIVLDSSTELIGTIDPLNKEYRITNGDGATWAYSIELGEWMGEYEYTDKAGTIFKDRLFSVNDTDLVEHNVGNTFNGVEYDTVIESVATPQELISEHKMYRKFYVGIKTDELETGDVIFTYGKDYNDQIQKDLSTTALKDGLFNVGIQPSQVNARQIFWGIKTKLENFVIDLVSYYWSMRKRR
jgi:hypothetical protein